MKNTLLALFLVALMSFSLVSAINDDAQDLDWGTLRINGDFVGNDEVLAVEEGEALEIRLGLEANADIDNIEVDAKISGYEYSDYENLQDSTHLFDVQAGNTKYVNLEVQMPNRLNKDEYTLRLRVLDRNGDAMAKEFTLSVEPTRHGIAIADVSVSPGNTVKAGRSLLTTVLLENFGDRTQRDVKVTVAIPELGISATEFVDVVDTDDNNIEFEDVPEMFLSIPANAAEGSYTVVVTAKYDDLRETVSKQFSLNVLANEMFADSNGKLVLAVGPQVQNAAVGSSVTYGVALTNAGRTSKAYTVQAVAGDWADVKVSESLVVLEAGKNKVVYVELTPNSNAVAGENVASLLIKSGDDVLETVSLKANVGEAIDSNGVGLRNGLEIALIVLVVLLVVIGLIVGFSRLRKEDDDEETYY
jgi:uncharacterized membrane protein